MYKYDLNITIFTNDKNIELNLNDIKPKENYNFNINFYHELINDEIKKANIIIVDSCFDVKKIKNYLNEETKVIAILDEFNEDIDFVDEIIIKPLNHVYLVKIVNKLVNQIDLEDKKNYLNYCLETVVNSMPDMFWIKSIDGIHTLLNDSFCEIVGKEKEDITGKDHYYIWDVSKDDPNSGADLCKESEDKVIKAGQTLSSYETVKSINGTKQLITYKTPLYDKFGKAIGTVGFGHDITDMRNLGLANQILLNNLPIPILIKDAQGKIQEVNNIFVRYFGVEKDKIIGTDYLTWDEETFSTKYNNERGFIESEFINNGNKKIVELRLSNILDVFGNVTGQNCCYLDVTLERKLQKKLKDQSNTDVLTKLFNRAYLREYVDDIKDGETISIIYLDLDHFKQVNDTYGHAMGDKALVTTANILTGFFQNNPIFRMGGDEFAIVILGEVSYDELAKLTNNLLMLFINTIREIKEFSEITPSIGVAQGINSKNIFSTILHKSDDAMYKAKANGRACVFIDREPVIKENIKSLELNK